MSVLFSFLCYLGNSHARIKRESKKKNTRSKELGLGITRETDVYFETKAKPPPPH